ncbi:MAG: DNA recombination protein RmuC [Fimbriimonadaceae bacterium]|nr:DNA recombination protein RmuC [Fimbriimonadaceae bacterium]
MDGLWIVVGVFVGLVVGGAFAWTLARARQSALQVMLDAASRRAAEQDEQLRKATADLEGAQNSLSEYGFAVTRLETELAERERAHGEKLAAYETAREAMADSFANLAGKALTESREALQKDVQAVFDGYKKALEGEDEQRRVRIERLLEPVKDGLTKLDEETKRLEQARNTSFGALFNKITELDQNQVKLSTETTRLVRALQDSGQAGQWGEFVLERVFELAGMTENVDYVLQPTLDDGKRPDAIVKMPGGRELVVDSKAPMKSYLEAQNADSPESARVLVNDHAAKLYEHAKVLAKRDYTHKSEAVDFSVMFVSSESSYRSAVEARPSLIEDCMAVNVVVATPTTLLALLRAVSYGWQQEKLANEAKQIQQDAARLYKSLGDMTAYYDDMGKNLSKAVDSYEALGGSLERNVLPAARRFKDAGVQTTKPIVEPRPVHKPTRVLKSAELIGDALPGLALSDPSESS